MDLAEGHVAALKKSLDPGFNGWTAYNLGTGEGKSVLEMISAFEKASGKKISYEIVARRAGDIASSFADCTRAEKELQWKAKRSLDDMCME